MASLSEVKAIAEKMEDQCGHIVSQEDVAKLLSDNHLKKIEDAGFVSMVSPEFSSRTKRNYLALLASQGNISISHTRTVKTTTKYAAENSIHACISKRCQDRGTRGDIPHEGLLPGRPAKLEKKATKGTL